MTALLGAPRRISRAPANSLVSSPRPVRVNRLRRIANSPKRDGDSHVQNHEQQPEAQIDHEPQSDVGGPTEAGLVHEPQSDVGGPTEARPRLEPQPDAGSRLT